MKYRFFLISIFSIGLFSCNEGLLTYQIDKIIIEEVDHSADTRSTKRHEITSRKKINAIVAAFKTYEEYPSKFLTKYYVVFMSHGEEILKVRANRNHFEIVHSKDKLRMRYFRTEKQMDLSFFTDM